MVAVKALVILFLRRVCYSEKSHAPSKSGNKFFVLLFRFEDNFYVV